MFLLRLLTVLPKHFLRFQMLFNATLSKCFCCLKGFTTRDGSWSFECRPTQGGRRTGSSKTRTGFNILNILLNLFEVGKLICVT
jgi:hypothetical protein